MKAVFFCTIFIFCTRLVLAQPANDDCANASLLCPNTVVSATNVAATPQCGGADGDCSQSGTWGQCYDVDNSVWFMFTTNNAGGAVTINIQNISCINPTGDNELQAVLISAGTPCTPSTYIPLDCNSASSADFILSGAGLAPMTTYYVQIDGDNNPTPVAECNFDITISGPAVNRQIQTTTQNPTCNGGNDGNATVNPTVGVNPFSYQWDAAAGGGSSQTATGLSAGTYLCTVSDGSGCDTIVQVTLTDPQAMTLLTSSTDATCGSADGSTIVSPSNGTPPYTFNWTGGQTTQTATGLSSGLYTVTVSDNNGCSQTAIAVVNDQNGPVVSAVPTNVSCNGGSDGSAAASVLSGTSPYTYLWTPGNQSGATATGLSAGSYTVLVTDNNGCSTGTQATVNEPAALNTNTSATNETCGATNGSATIFVSGGTSPFSYSWSGGQTSSTVTGLSAGTYAVTVTDNNSCQTTDNVTVGLDNNGPSITTSTTDVSCNGMSDGSATATPSSGSSPYTFYWSNGQTTTTANNLAAGSYSCTVTDNNGCDSIVTVTISEPLPITANTIVTDASCGNSDGSATVTPSGGTSPYTYNWSSGGNANTENNLAAGSYTVTITSSDGCSQPITVVVSNIGGPQLSSSATPVSCPGGSDGAASTSVVSGGTSPFSYTWNSGGSSAIETNLSAGTYTVTVTDQNNCLGVDAVTVSEPAPMQISSSSNDASCGQSDGSASVLASSGGTAPYSYLWSSGGTSTTENNLAAGTYSVTVTDANSCDSVLSVTVNEVTGITDAQTSTVSASCNQSDGSITVDNVTGGTPSYQYSLDNASFQSSTLFSGLSAGGYTVYITDANNCSYNTTATITQDQQPTANATTVPATCSGTGSLEATASGGMAPYTYSLNGGADQSSGSYVALSPGAYIVIVTDANNCTDTVTTAVANDCVLKPVNPTTGFTPNADGINETWTVSNLSDYKNSKVDVYDRWGQKVFHSKGYDTPWDGTSLGFPVPAATYYYVIRLDTEDKSTGILTGYVAIVR